jgi:hypothetical protein
VVKTNVAIGILCDIWIAFGLRLDEIHHVIYKKEVFWTTPHLIIYSGMFVLFIQAVRNWLRYRYQSKYYPISSITLGIIPFMLGLMGDTILHVFLNVRDESIFGRPTHLLILEGLVIFLFSPTRSKKVGEERILIGSKP